MNAKFIAFWALAMVLLLPAPALAYFDPGTGNIFIYVVGTLLAASFHMLKSLGFGLWRVFKPAAKGTIKKDRFNDLVIFSEGKAYWHTFKPIIEALLDKEQPFRYLSLDIDDPGLTIESPLVKNRYIGDGAAAFARLGSTRAQLMLATTPNIGTPGYPLPRPKHVQCLAHVCHGVGGVDAYHKYAVDSYDAVILMSECFEPSVRRLESLRGLPPKELVGLGLPYFDELKKGVRGEGGESPGGGNPTILIAPSWGAKSCLALAAELIIPQLLAAEYEVILRPHPQSRRSEPELLAAVKEAFGDNEGFSLDQAVDASESMKKAGLMISDMSGVRFDFAFLYEKPVLTISYPLAEGDYEASDLGGAWEEEVSSHLGPVAAAENLSEIIPLVKRGLSMRPLDMRGFRESWVRNFGCSGEAIAEWLINKCRSGGSAKESNPVPAPAVARGDKL